MTMNKIILELLKAKVETATDEELQQALEIIEAKLSQKKSLSAEQVERSFKSMKKQLSDKPKCVPEDKLLASYPAKLKCKYCGQIWTAGTERPDCNRRELTEKIKNELLNKALVNFNDEDQEEVNEEDPHNIEHLTSEFGKLFNELAQTLSPLFNIQTVPQRTNPEGQSGER